MSSDSFLFNFLLITRRNWKRKRELDSSFNYCTKMFNEFKSLRSWHEKVPSTTDVWCRKIFKWRFRERGRVFSFVIGEILRKRLRKNNGNIHWLWNIRSCNLCRNFQQIVFWIFTDRSNFTCYYMLVWSIYFISFNETAEKKYFRLNKKLSILIGISKYLSNNGNRLIYYWKELILNKFILKSLI